MKNARFRVNSQHYERRKSGYRPRDRAIGAPKEESQPIRFPANLNGIFAFVSLLHLPPEEVEKVIRKGYAALNPGGAFCISLKTGDGSETKTDEFGTRTYYYYRPEQIFSFFPETASRHEVSTSNVRGREFFEIFFVKHTIIFSPMPPSTFKLTSVPERQKIVPVWLRWIPGMAAIDDIKPLSSEELKRFPGALRDDPGFWFFLKPVLILIIGVVIFPRYGLMYVFDTLGWAYDPVCRDYASPRGAKCFEFEAVGWGLSLFWFYWLLKFHIKRK